MSKKKRKPTSKRIDKKELKKYLRRVLQNGSIEVTILRELVLTRYYADGDRAMKLFLQIVEKAVSDHVQGAAMSDFAVCSSSGVMRLGNSHRRRQLFSDTPMGNLPAELYAQRASRGFSDGDIDCDMVCDWMASQLSDGRLIPIADIREHFNEELPSAQATIAWSCVACSSKFEIVEPQGIPCCKLRKS